MKRKTTDLKVSQKMHEQTQRREEGKDVARKRPQHSAFSPNGLLKSCPHKDREGISVYAQNETKDEMKAESMTPRRRRKKKKLKWAEP